MADSPAIAAPQPAPATPATPHLPKLPPRLHEIWQRVHGHPLAQRAALPALVTTLVAVLLFGWLFFSPPERTALYSDLPESDKAAVVKELEKDGFNVRLDERSGAVLLPPADHARARMLLAGAGLPNAAPDGDDLISGLPLGTSRAVEGEKIKSARERELARSIETIDGVRAARVIIATPDPSPFIRDQAPVTASVTVTLAPGRTLSAARTRAIVHLVAGAVPGLAPDDVAIADQTGRLLSGDPDSPSDRLDERRIRTTARMEEKMRDAILQLLTPLVGPGNVTAQVAVDLDYSSRDTSSEQYDPRGALRSEAVTQEKASQPRAIGIPGAISNTVPAVADVTATPPADTASGPTEQQTTSESATRNYELGHSVEVTSREGSHVHRLTAAVAIKADALGPANQRAKLLGEMQQLVEGAVGYDEGRGDRVTVVARSFAPAADTSTPLWQQPIVVDSSKWGAALLVFLGLILFVIRPLLKRIPTPTLPALSHDSRAEPRLTVDGGELETEAGGADAIPDEAIEPLLPDYSRKLAEMRQIAQSDTARATAIARRLLETDETNEEDA